MEAIINTIVVKFFSIFTDPINILLIAMNVISIYREKQYKEVAKETTESLNAIVKTMSEISQNHNIIVYKLIGNSASEEPHVLKK